MRWQLPARAWLEGYNREMLLADVLAAAIVTVMLIPQSLAYAMLAGLPPEVGLYASLLPLLVYGLLGSSRTLSVGPVAVISLMTAAAIGSLGAVDPALKLALAAALALVSGVMLLVLGLLRLGFLANFLSHPVIAGFISASALVIAISQLKHLFGIEATGHTLPELLHSLSTQVAQLHLYTLAVGVATLAFLLWVRRGLEPVLKRLGVGARAASVTAKTGPALAVVVTTLLAWQLDWQSAGVALVGEVPRALPALVMPAISRELWLSLVAPALLIAIIGFVESVSVAQTLAAKRRQRIDPDQELIALGAANISAGITQGLPVTGGFSRSVVNFDAGAQTPAAGMFTALAIALVALSLTPLLAFLPKVTLATTIIVAVLSLVDFSILKKTWHYSRADFIAVVSTLVVTLVVGVEQGIATGVAISVLIYLIKSSRPHMAIVGQVEGTEHYRNINRHQVITHPSILSVRVDENLFFANARFLEEHLYAMVAEHKNIRHVILQASAINAIDMSALESLEEINQRLADSGVCLHLSEVKGPVMDCLNKTDFIEHLCGRVHLSHHQAVMVLLNHNTTINNPPPTPPASGRGA